MTMKRTGIASNRSWSDVAYSRAVRLGNLIEVAGTTSSGPAGEILHPGDMYMQAREICSIIKRSIDELGGSLDDVVRTRVFVTDISQWEAAGRAHFEAFGHMEYPPASAFYGINELLHADLLIEIEATAIVGDG
ncbi:Rid family hydrolase [Ilumatobacter sp.]|uniref:Rid family hydrolase n=1 Tax=Ilumatobacter sp. TaxID=1967498 RepID=UPI0037521E7F